MSITKLFENPHVITQTADSTEEMEEASLALCLDSGGIICLSQGENQIIINKKTVPELVKVLKLLAAK